MKISNYTRLSLSLLLMAGAFTACRDQVDFEAEHQKLIEFQYIENFANRFGDIAADQDFNMAAQVTATVSVDEWEDLTDAYIKVYTDDPASPEAYLLAKYPLTGTTMDFTFDFPKTSDKVFVVRQRGNGYYAGKFATIEDGKCNVSFSDSDDSATRAAAEQPDFYWPSDMEVGNSMWPTQVPSDRYEIENHVLNIVNIDNIYYSNTFKAAYVKYNLVVVPIKVDSRNIYIHDAKVGEINLFTGGYNIYLGGNVTIDNWKKEGDGTEPFTLYCMPGSKVKIGRSDFNNKAMTIVICNGATVELDAVHAQSNIYNRGTLKLTDRTQFKFGNQCFVQNEGTIQITGKWDMTQDNTVFLNKGTVTAASMQVAGSADFYNSPTGTVNIAGQTLVNSNSSTWYNRGTYKTGSMDIESASDNWINECKLEVTNELRVHTGCNNCALHILGYVHCGSYYQNVERVELSADAMIEVDGRATFQFNCGNIYNDYSQGIYSIAPQGSKAIFKAQTIHAVNKSDICMTYGGRLVVACKNNTNSYNYQLADNNVIFATNADAYTIEAGDCHLEYNPEPVPAPISDETPYTWIFACEDLGASDDFDFNDVVFSVSYVSGQTTMYVTPLAAGGTMSSVIFYQDKRLGEIHNLLKGAPESTLSGTYEMLNTTPGQHEYTVTPLEVAVPSNLSIANNPDFKIAVIPRQQRAQDYQSMDGTNKATIVQAPDRSNGSATPQMLVLPSGWIWPRERHQINDAYPSFSNWVTDNLSDWIGNADNSHLFKSYQYSTAGGDLDPDVDPDNGNDDTSGNNTPVPDAPSVPEGGEIVLFEGNQLLEWSGIAIDFNWNNIQENSTIRVYCTFAEGTWGCNVQLVCVGQDWQWNKFLETTCAGQYVECTLNSTILNDLRNGREFRVAGGNNDGTLNKVIIKN